MINLKEHFKLTAVYTFFAVFPAMLQLIVYPLIEGENRLGAVDFGYLGITEAIISMVFLICTFGMGTGIARFYYDHKDDAGGYKNLISSILSGIIGRGLLLMGIVILFAPAIGQLFPQPDLQNFGEYGPALVIAGLNRSVIATLLVLYRNEKKIRAFVIVSFFSGILRSGFQLAGVFLYDLSFIGYIYGTAAGGTILAIILVVFTYSTCGFYYKRSLLKAVHKFAWPLFLTELIYWGLLFADRFFLLNNPAELGIYDNAMKFAVGIQMVIQGLTSAVQPEIFRFMKEGMKIKETEIKTLVNLFIAEAAGIIAITIIPVMIFIHLFYETELTMSGGLIAIIFVRFMLRAQYQIFSWPLLFKKKTSVFLFINSAVLCINLAINWFLTPSIGFYGAIIAFLSAFLVQIIVLRIVQVKVAPVRYNTLKVLYFPLGMIFTAILLEIVKIIFSLDPFVTSGILVILIFGGLLLIYKGEVTEILVKKFR
jgi:O-antigen/teichoic acid export membrane protein